MMGGGTSVLVNGGRRWLECSKQTEIRLAILLKILQIAHFGTGGLAGVKKTSDGYIHRYFPRDMANSPGIVPVVARFTDFTRPLT